MGVDGWLTLTTEAVGIKGHHYELGPLGWVQKDAWVALGKTLFGLGGVLDRYRMRPIFSSYGLNPHGCLILAFVERFGPVSGKEVVAQLLSFMDRKTVKKRLGNIVSEGLLFKSNDEYHAPADLRKRVEDHERWTGAAERRLQVDNARIKTWIEFQAIILGEPEIKMLKAAMRKLECFYCCHTPPPTGNEVEHFPPIHWGGSDEYSLLLPICVKCNRRHGQQLRKTKSAKMLVLEEPLRIVWNGDHDEAIAHFMLLMLFRNLEYAVAMNDRRLDDARHAATSTFPIWVALKGAGMGAKLIYNDTGEIVDIQVGAEYEKLKEYLSDYAGVPELLEPTYKSKPSKTMKHHPA